MTAMSLVRRRERQGFILSKFIGRSLILPKGDPVISDIQAAPERLQRLGSLRSRYHMDIDFEPLCGSYFLYFNRL